MIFINALLVTLATTPVASASEDIPFNSIQRMVPGDMVAIVHFREREERSTRISSSADGESRNLTFYADKYDVVSSQDPSVPKSIVVLHLNRSRPAAGNGTGLVINPEPLPDSSLNYLLVGTRAKNGALRSGDFGQGAPFGRPNDSIPAAGDEVALDRIDATNATQVASASTKPFAYVKTILSSFKSKGPLSFGETRFLYSALTQSFNLAEFDGVTPNEWIRRQFAPIAVERSKNLVNVEEAAVSASLATMCGQVKAGRTLFSALSQLVDRGETSSRTVDAALENAVFGQSDVTADELYSLAVRCPDGRMRQLLVARSPAGPVTASAIANLQKLLDSKDYDLGRLVVDRLAMMAKRPDMGRPTTAGEAWTTVREFWKSKKPSEILTMSRTAGS